LRSFADHRWGNKTIEIHLTSITFAVGSFSPFSAQAFARNPWGHRQFRPNQDPFGTLGCPRGESHYEDCLFCECRDDGKYHCIPDSVYCSHD
jgi:hypothetical protein